MSKRGSNFFEEHVEKMVLAIVGLICLWLLITRVLISPNYIEYDDKKFGPGDIDNHISKQAEVLGERLNRKPEPKPPYKPNVDKFIAKVDSAISDIDVSLYPPVPPYLKDIDVRGEYRIPLIGKVNEPAVEHIRAVAYVPVEEINEENIYGQGESEPNDIDFVSVEAKFDVAGLYDRFYESFAGENLRDEWRDPCLAVPIFAAVQLQRQQLLSDGSWSDWQVVPRTKIDHRDKMFGVIEELKDLPPGGMKVRLLQFSDPGVTMDLLQPEAYMIASAKEEWFPPSLHKEYVEQQREIDAQEKRVAKAAERQERKRERESERSDRRSRTTTTRGAAGGMPPGMGPFGGGGGPFGGGGGQFGGGGPFGGGMPTRRTQPRRSRSERKSTKERPARSKEALKPTKNIYKEFEKIKITQKTDIAKMEELLVFWAHDDTVESRKSYRYRMRLGVFNPIAGTNQFIEQDKSLKNKVVLWSEFSDATEAVKIPGTLYFFPREIQEAAKTVTVTAARYVLGYWYCKDFMVKQGEVIGKRVDYKATDEEKEKDVTVPEAVDYVTGAVLLDVMPVNDWSSGKNMRARHYFDMLYSFDGADIEHIPIKSRYWAEGLQVKFNEIRRSEKEPKEPLRGWGGRMGPRRLPGMPGMPGMPPGLFPPYGPGRGPGR
jgi:uncharacterized membrane protein YgcG